LLPYNGIVVLVVEDMDRKSVVDKYICLLNDWNSQINFVQSASMFDVMDRHIRDSQQIRHYINYHNTVLDVGSGAGFPGIILSIFGFKKVVLCEKNFKKAMFLKEVKKRLKLSFEVFDDDINKFSISNCVSRGMSSDITMVSRAFGPLVKLMYIMERIGVKNGVFHKGKKHAAEIEVANKYFEFALQIKQSVTSREGVIVLVSDLMRK
jgi:16S rRNA (guanine527-N7)-methyltransferase